MSIITSDVIHLVFVEWVFCSLASIGFSCSSECVVTMSYLVRSCAEILPNVATGFGSNIFLGFGRNNNALEGFILRGP